MYTIIGDKGQKAVVKPFFDHIIDVIHSFKYWEPMKDMSFTGRDLPSRDMVDEFIVARKQRDKEGRFIAEILLPIISVANAPSRSLAEQVIEDKYDIYREMQKEYIENWILQTSQSVEKVVNRFNDIAEASMDFNLFRDSMLYLGDMLEKWFRENGLAVKNDDFDKDLLINTIEVGDA